MAVKGTLMKLETEYLRLTCLQEGAKIVGFALDVRGGDTWHPLATTVPLSHLIYRDKEGNRHETALPATACCVVRTVSPMRGHFGDVRELITPCNSNRLRGRRGIILQPRQEPPLPSRSA